MRVFELISPIALATKEEIDNTAMFSRALELTEEKSFQQALTLLEQYLQFYPTDMCAQVS